MANQKDNIAVATSASVSVVLTVAVIVVACIIVRKKKNLSLCSKMKKRKHDDSPVEEMQVIYNGVDSLLFSLDTNFHGLMDI